MKSVLTRRGFIAAGAALAGSMMLPAALAATRKKVRIGMIGTGMRGQVLLQELLRRDDVEVAALCDIEPVMLGKA
ncbi:MAG TPA: gfo/Idh/MocA family oxidoreductase, partial [Pseudoduganella sp.]